ncbi:hypothetical protein TruAng_002202 [Truncatella angustata]|nr:hypothetical protein TruAng_002202 [Truncatella angustata]
MATCKEVEFKTLDGLILRGTLYSSGEPQSPAVIMTPGYFQESGIASLVYDPRTIGASEGQPRNNIVPALQISDYSDALTFIKSRPEIDSNRIAFWGFSFSGAIALSAAALDKRASSVLAVCPLTIWELEEKKWKGVMAKCMQDRESRMNGNVPFSIPMVSSNGQNPAGFGSGVGTEELDLITESKDKIPNFQVTTTIQTYWHVMSWGGPFNCLKWLQGMPVLVVTPEEDRISPAHKQKELIFDAIPTVEDSVSGEEPKKEFHLVATRGHMDVLDGDSFRAAMDVQVRFLKKWSRS